MSKLCVPILVVFLASLPASGAAGEVDLPIAIQISPHTLVEGAPVGWVTVHADIAYWSVDRSSVELDGLPVAWTKADSQGNLVAKFREDEVKALVEPPAATLTLTGWTKAGLSFAGRDTIQVGTGKGR